MKIKEISKNQISLINYLKKEISLNKKKIKDFSIYDYFYHSNWTQSYGSLKVKKKFDNGFKFFDYLQSLIILTHQLTIREFNKYHIIEDIKNYDDIKNLIITYTNNDELKKKVFKNKLFNISPSNLKSSLCLAINFDFATNKNYKHHKNTILINKKRDNYLFNISFYLILLKNFFYIILRKKKTFDKSFYEILDNVCHSIFKNYKIKNVYMIYESQPHQHYLIKNFRYLNKDLSISGYLHSSLPSMPIDFLYKNFEPNILMINGVEQKKILNKNLGWPKTKLKVINSFRYKKEKKERYLNKIFLPYSINNEKKLVALFSSLFLSKENNIYPTFDVKNHPFMGKGRKHVRLFSQLNEIQKKIKKKNLVKNKLTIVLGVSASILEILEHGIDVINICENEFFEPHNEKIWQSIRVKKINKNIFKYSLKKKGSIIKFGVKNEFIKNFNV